MSDPSKKSFLELIPAYLAGLAALLTAFASVLALFYRSDPPAVAPAPTPQHIEARHIEATITPPATAPAIPAPPVKGGLPPGSAGDVARPIIPSSDHGPDLKPFGYKEPAKEGAQDAAQEPTKVSANAEACKAMVGRWNWSLNGIVTINADQTLIWTPAPGNPLPSAIGRWKCGSQASRKITFMWTGGFIDTLILDDEGNALSGRSSANIPVGGMRAE